MGTVVLYVAASLDGFVADEDGGVEWLETFEDTHEGGEPGGSFEAFFERVDCLVVGANSYEQILTFGEWPYGDTRTVVTTHRELPAANEHVEFYDGELRPLVRDVTGAHELVWLVGGAELAQRFLEADLVDQIRLSIVPVLLGGGIALFDDSGSERALHLRDSTAYENGIVELQYDVLPA